MKSLVSIILIVFCIACSRPTSTDPAASDSVQTLSIDPADADAIHKFVHEFYEWYVPLATSENLKGPASDVAITNRKASFSPELWSALKEDADAQAHSDEIVGIDWDPFLFSQDPCEKYEVGAVRNNKNDFLVDIYATCQGQKLENPSITAILSKINDRFYFTNFVNFKTHTDLMQSLSRLKKARDQPQ